MTPQEQAFADFKNRALERDLLVEAKARGAKLRRAGREWIGPCPNCAGTDRFSINPTKGVFNCRGAEGGNVISMVMHLDGVTFVQACEALTGETNPSGAPAKPLSDAERAARDKTRQANEARQRLREAEEAAREEDTREYCAKIWSECLSIGGTIAEQYLRGFDLPMPPDGWPECLGFHPALQYPGLGKLPALVARVDDVAGNLTGIWREFIGADGRKAKVDQQKLGLGPVAGGAVRMGGLAPRIGCAEGLRTAFGAWALIGFRYPIWPCLSTSGLIGFEVPLGVDSIVVWPDGDRPIKKFEHHYLPAVPAGRKAAQALVMRAREEGVAATTAAEPPPERDYLDLWQSHVLEMA